MPYALLMSYVLGFDGGGTKTECVLMDSSDHVVARTFAGPSNPFRIGVEPAVRAIEEAANLSLQEANLHRDAIMAIGAGIAGTTSPELHDHTLKAMQTLFPGVRVTLLTDLEAALAAAGPGPRIVLVAGTGSAAIGCNVRTEIFRAGGWGRFSSDEGSAFDVGRRAIAYAVSAPAEALASSLNQQILAQLESANWSDVQRRAETAPDDVYPRIFPVIAAAADAGDDTARELLLTAISHLSALVRDVADHLDLHDTPFTLARTGGMIGRSAFFDAQLNDALSKSFPRAQLGGLKISPAEAAALAAKA